MLGLESSQVNAGDGEQILYVSEDCWPWDVVEGGEEVRQICSNVMEAFKPEEEGLVNNAP